MTALEGGADYFGIGPVFPYEYKRRCQTLKRNEAN